MNQEVIIGEMIDKFKKSSQQENFQNQPVDQELIRN
jgi:hypothetical protein